MVKEYVGGDHKNIIWGGKSSLSC